MKLRELIRKDYKLVGKEHSRREQDFIDESMRDISRRLKKVFGRKVELRYRNVDMEKRKVFAYAPELDLVFVRIPSGLRLYPSGKTIYYVSVLDKNGSVLRTKGYFSVPVDIHRPADLAPVVET